MSDLLVDAYALGGVLIPASFTLRKHNRTRFRVARLKLSQDILVA